MAKKFTEREKDIYRAGFWDGENQLRQTINCIKAANSGLMDELLRLDFHKPGLGDPKHIIISLKITILKKIINALQRNVPESTRYHYAKTLQKLLDKHEERQRIIAAKIEKGLLNTE